MQVRLKGEDVLSLKHERFASRCSRRLSRDDRGEIKTRRVVVPAAAAFDVELPYIHVHGKE